jgi:Fe-S-cluster-containing dehydrogenase component
MCYDRTSIGKNPMCTTVCPSRALHFGTWEEIETMRPRSVPQNQFRFGNQEVHTKVYMMVPRDAPMEYLDVVSAMAEPQSSAGAAVSGSPDYDPMLAGLYNSTAGA